jgi:hypothetical protein
VRASDLGPRTSARAVVLLVAVAACDSRSPEATGIGSYVFGRTTAGSIHDGVCQPTDASDGRKVTWCFELPPIKVFDRVADVDAYFNGTDKTAPLIEVQLKVRGCVEDELDRWLRARFGPPYETRSTREYWKNSFLWIAAKLPSEPGRCLVHLLPIAEGSEIERIKRE